MIIINNLFWIGTAIVILAMLRGFGLANNYTSKRAKLICIMHFIGLFMMGYGVSDLAWSYGFQNTWWETGGQALFFILGFGAFLESQKMLPMAPTNIQNMAERVATEAGQVLINSEPEHPAIGSVKKTDDAKPTYEPTKTTSLHDIEASSKVPSEPAEEFAETYWEQLVLAEQGDADAQFNLGLMHVNGQGVPVDYSEGLKWYRLAAEQGDADAQFNLGLMYVNGQGVPLDYSEGVKWYRLAAEQGDADAQTNLGLMHVNGQGVPVDYSEGVKWYRLAAEQGNPNAQNNLAFMHFAGQGVPQDFVSAHMWYNLSAAKGNEDGVEGRDLAAAKMTPAAIEEAQRRARVCMASNYQDCD